MRRFFIPVNEFAGPFLTITGDNFRHMIKVLRLKIGAQLLLVDQKGNEAVAVIEQIARESLVVTLNPTPAPAAAEASPQITLYQGLPKGDKMEYIIQKATELGAHEIVPFEAMRTIIKMTGVRQQERVTRWQSIAREAARQSHRSFVPKVFFAQYLPEVLHLAQHKVKLLLWEEEQNLRLKETLAALPVPDRIAVIIGPEGGISSEEAASAVQCGFIPISLGKRILRTETASLAILSILQFYWGDIS